MKRRWKTILSLWLAGAITIGSGELVIGLDKQHVSAERTQPTIDEEINYASELAENLEEEKRRLEEDLKTIENKKDNVLEYIKTLDEKLTELTDKISDNQTAIITTRAEISTLQDQKMDAIIRREEQYETMKKRIKYMYEEGDDSYLEVLFEAKNFADLFSKAEYISKVTEYDQNMLLRFQETCDEIILAQKTVQEKLEELTAYKESLNYEKETLDSLVKKKTKQLAVYDKSLTEAQGQLTNYQELIAEQEERLEILLEEKRRQIEAEEAKKAEEKDGENSGTMDAYAEDDSSSGYRWPLRVAGTITSQFGYRNVPTAGASTYHKGVDIAAPTGTVIVAAKSGRVVTSTYASDAGNYICIYHGDGAYTYYMHCSSLLVSVGEEVKKGQKIALVGSTGVSTGPHLHFGMHIGGDYVNPLNYVSY